MKLKAGKNPPEEINVFVEIPQGSNVKYELDKESGLVFVDRFLYTAMKFPFNYGFMPETLGEDKDPLDIVVLASRPIQAGTVVPARPIGLLEMKDEAGIDTKIICVPTEKIDPWMAKVKDVKDLDKNVKDQIKHFFEHYKELEPGKWVKLKDWKGKAEAVKEIKAGVKRGK